MPPKPLSIPFYRPLYGPNVKGKKQARGQDVVAVKRALSRSGYMPWNTFDNVYNTKTVSAVHRLQQSNNVYPATGHYGPKTHNLLVSLHAKKKPQEWSFDKYAEFLYDKARDDRVTKKDVVDFIVRVMFDMYEARADIDYSQMRPVYPIVQQITDPRRSRVLDCSGFLIYSWYLADRHFAAKGVDVPSPDPKYGYSGYGNTWSLKDGGKRVTEGTIQVGDCVFYTGHVAIVVRTSPSINVISHGSKRGPLYLPYRYRNDIEEIRRYEYLEA